MEPTSPTWKELNQKGFEFYQQGLFNQAIQLTLQAVNIAATEIGKENNQYANLISNLGLYYQYTGQYEKALGLLSESIKIYQSIGENNTYLYAISLKNLGLTYVNMGKHKEAEFIYNQALPIVKVAKGKNSENYAAFLFDMGAMYLLSNNVEKSEEYYLECKEIQKLTIGNQHGVYAQTVNYLAELYRRTNRFSEAIPLFEEAMNIYESTIGKENPHYTSSSGNLAFTLFQKGDFKEALIVCDECIEVKEKVFGKDNYQYADSIKLKADISTSLNQFKEAEKLYQTFLSSTIKLLGSGHIYAISGRISLAELYLSTGELDAAEALLESVMMLIGNSQNYAMIARVKNDLGIAYYHKKEISKSEKAYRDSLTAWEMVSGRELESHYFNTLNSLGLLIMEKGQLQEASHLIEKSYRLKKTNLGENHPTLWASINNMAILRKSQGHYREALEFAKAYFDIVKIHHSQDANLIAKSHNNLGELYRSVGEYQKAVPMLVEAMEICKNDSTIYASLKQKIENNLGLVYSDMGEYPQAETIFQSAYDNLDISVENDPTIHALLQSNLANLYIAWGKFDLAESRFIQSINILETHKAQDNAGIGFLRNNLGGLYIQLADYKSAFVELELAHQEGIKLGESHALTSTSFNSLGYYYLNIGDYEKSEHHLLKAIEIERKYRSDYSLLSAQVQSNLGSLYHALHLIEKSERHFLGCLKIREKIQGINHPEYALTLNNLGILYSQTGHNQKALEIFLQAKEICGKIFDKESPLTATVLCNIADNYRAQKLPEAEKSFLEAINFLEKAKGPNHPDMINVKNNLAMLYLEQNRFPESVSIFKDLLKSENKLDPQYLLLTVNFSLLYLRMGNMEKAIHFSLKGWDLMKEKISKIFPFLSEKERFAFFASLNGQIEAFKNLAILSKNGESEIIGHLYNFLLATKSTLLNQSELLRKRILTTNDPSVKETFQKWSQIKEELVNNYLGRKTISYQELTHKEEIADKYEKELSRKSKVFSKTNQSQNQTWQSLKEHLAPEEAAIEIFRYRKFVKDGFEGFGYGAVILLPNKAIDPILVRFSNTEEVEGKMFTHYQGYLNSTRSSGRWIAWEKEKKNKNIDEDLFDQLYPIFWKPIQDVLDSHTEISKIFLSKAGVFHKINLATLKSPNGKYVADLCDIHLVASTREIAEIKNQTKLSHISPKKALLMGGVDFQKGKHKTENLPPRPAVHRALQPSFSNGTSLTDLPGTKVEVEAIHNLLQDHQWEVSTFLGKEAVENHFYQQTDIQLIHIATHGYFEEDQEPRLFFGKLNASFSITNPMLKSGLLMAGAETSINQLQKKDTANLSNRHDGIFSAYEASNLDLQNVELVVLSACETGLGSARNGEGVSGLQNAFIIAGVKTLIISLWKVDDDATKDLMIAFYEFWLESGDKRKAFKEAQLKVREKYPSPYYWGAFVMVGE